MAPSEAAILAVIRASRPEFRSAHDRVAFALHSAFLASGYYLGATGSRAASGAPVPSGHEAPIDGWNELDNGYAFKYFTDEKGLAKSVDVKYTIIGDVLMVDVAPEGGSDLLHTEIKVTVFAQDSATGNYAQQYKSLNELLRLFELQILNKCNSKPSVMTTRDTGKMTLDDQSYTVPRRPYPASPKVGTFREPVGINDLLPGPGAGIFDRRRDGGFESGEAGNLVGPGNRIWGNNDPLMEDTGAFANPPGARRDPFGPPGVPGFEPQRFGRGGGRGDLQHFPM